jgi:hypothetical protein
MALAAGMTLGSAGDEILSQIGGEGFTKRPILVPYGEAVPSPTTVGNDSKNRN